MTTALSPLYAPLMASAAMRAICDDRAYLQAMLDVEAALARALVEVNVIPVSAVVLGPPGAHLQLGDGVDVPGGDGADHHAPGFCR